jgi:hypothetical protein
MFAMEPRDRSLFRLLNYSNPSGIPGRIFKALSALSLMLTLAAFVYGKSIQDSFNAHPKQGAWLLGAVVFGAFEAIVLFLASLICQYGGKTSGKYLESSQRTANKISIVWAIIGTLAVAGYVLYSIWFLSKNGS